MESHLATCPLCEATCGLRVETQGDRVVSVRGDKDHVFSKGYICPKAAALADLHHDEDRLRQPVKRVGDTWQTISWDQALDEVAENLKAVRDAHGKNAIGMYFGNPTVHSLGAMIFGPLFGATLPTRNRFSATSVDQLPHMLAARLMYGHQLMIPVPDVDRTDYLLMLGANPLASNGSIMTAPNIKGRLKGIQQRGGRVVTVDPRRTETAKLSDEHVFVRPGSDAFFLMAFLRALLARGADCGRLAPFVDGLDTLQDIVESFPLDNVAELTGVAADTIERLATEFLAAESPVCYGRIGVCTQEFGGLNGWLINCINIVTGRLDAPGGSMFPTPPAEVRKLAARAKLFGSYNRYQSRGRGLPEFSGELPVSALAEEIEEPGKNQIRALVTHAGNPVLSIPNGPRLEKALTGLDFMVSIDFYINETTKHADIILPPTAGLERDHFDIVFALFAVRNVAHYAPAVFQRKEDQRHDWEIFAELARRIVSRGWRGKAAGIGLSLARRLGPKGLLNILLRTGPFRLSVDQLIKKHPHGLDLGPLTSCLPGGLYRRDKKIRLCPTQYVDDVARLRKRADEPVAPLLLIGRRHLRSNNSWLHNSLRLVKGKSRCTLLVHPDDAAAHSVEDGSTVRVTSRVGAVDAVAEVTDEIMQGVVSLPHGWGHHRQGTRWRVAEAHAGVSANDLTDEMVLDTMSGNAALNGVPVTVQAVS